MAVENKQRTKKPVAKKPAQRGRGRPKLAPKKTRVRNPRSKSGEWYDSLGRPPKLTRELLEATEKYYQQKKKDRELPLVEELAVDVCDTDRHVIARWAARGEDRDWLKKQSPERQAIFKHFSSTIKKLATMQLMQYKVRGVADRSNAVTIFLMKADHGMIETQRHEHGGIGGKPIEFKPIEVLSTKGRKPTKAAK